MNVLNVLLYGRKLNIKFIINGIDISENKFIKASSLTKNER
jgi:hypothetical protein